MDPEPGETFEDPLYRLLGRALLVGVFDTQDVLATVATGVEKGEKRGADATDMQGAGGTRSEARAGVGHVVCETFESRSGGSGAIFQQNRLELREISKPLSTVLPVSRGGPISFHGMACAIPMRAFRSSLDCRGHRSHVLAPSKDGWPLPPAVSRDR